MSCGPKMATVPPAFTSISNPGKRLSNEDSEAESSSFWWLLAFFGFGHITPVSSSMVIMPPPLCVHLLYYLSQISLRLPLIRTLVVTFQFSSVQLLSCVRLFATPWITACQASLSITNSWSSPKLMSIESVMPCSHLILCRPLLLPPIPPNIRVFSNESTLCMRWSKY